jgi:predicted nuclease of predicted toxin-antitoxin system
VRILLDEQLPRQLARQFTDHDVRTVQRQGWAGLGNGELLRRAAAAGFEIFVTADQNLQFQQNLQQNLAYSPLGVIVLVAPSNALEDLLPLVPSVLEAVRNARPGSVQRVGAP